ncbi:MAG: CHASE2 domain-containing protein, partial [Verrucomicrobiota bacterium]
DAGKRLRKPIEALEKIASWGLVVLAGEDKFIREHYRPAEDFKEPSLAWRVANATLAGGAPDANRPRWINYYGPPGFLPKQSFADVLEPGLIPSEVFSNKVIFVGAHFGVGFKGGRGTDDFRTPYTRWTQNRSPGVEINATTYLNLAHGDWLEEMSPWIELSLVLLAGGLLALGLAVVRPLPAVGIAALAALLVAVASIALVWTTRIWFPWLIVCVVQIPAALGWSILLHAQRNSRVHTTSVLSVPTPLEATEPSNLQTIQAGSAKLNCELQIPDHTLVRTIGSGAYGDVWLARDVIGTFHAVKIIHRERFKTSDPFEREFRGIQKFTPISRQHLNWVHILHVGRNDQEGIFYYIMELGDDRVCGQRIDPQSYSPRTLAKDLERMRKLPVRDCLSIGIALASGLHFLHQHQLVHRDIKPSNVIFVNGVPKFADIGLVTTAATADSDRSYVGTEGFIAPEGPGTVVADVYSLGKLLYEASMGQDRKQFPAFPDSLAEREDRAALLELNKIILRACAAAPEQRCPTAEALMKDLQALQEKLFAGAALPREQSPRAPASPA